MAQINKDKSKWERGIKLAINFANIHGWNVIFRFRDSQESRADFSTKEIIINSRHPARVRYYILLHELGHAMEMTSMFYVSPVDLHGPRYNTLIYKVEKVKEEFTAWDRGYQIAKTNDWPLDDYFYAVRAKYISTYMIWANNRKHPHAKYTTRKRLTKLTNGNESKVRRIGTIQGISQNENIRSDGDSNSNIEQDIKK